MAREATAAARLDAEIAFDWLFWTLDPRDRQNTRREFILMPFQRIGVRETMDAIMDPHDLVIEKSRDEGVTWWILCCLLHCWLFERDFAALITSKDEDAVDSRKDPNCLLERLRWELRMIQKATPGIVPPDWEKFDKHLQITNPLNGSTIKGAATGGKVARQGRFNVIVYDEFATLDRPVQEQMMTAAIGAAPCQIVLSTPNGLGDRFSRMALSLRKNRRAVVDLLDGKAA